MITIVIAKLNGMVKAIKFDSWEKAQKEYDLRRFIGPCRDEDGKMTRYESQEACNLLSM